MKEHPIIFTAESVRAIQADRKTQTRRVITPQPPPGFSPAGLIIDSTYARDVGKWRFVDPGSSHIAARCPRWLAGDHLWIKEAWAHDGPSVEECRRRKEDVMPFDGTGSYGPYYRADGEDDTLKWRSPLFMPKWASRLKLEVVSVRAERLQDIGVADIQAEGISLPVDVVGCPPGTGHPLVQVLDNPYKPDTKLTTWTEEDYWRSAFACAWEKINRKRSPWSANDWVWRTEFRRLG